MPETNPRKFDKTALPKWAQKDEKVIKLCKLSLSFRANVCDAQTKQMQQLLTDEAHRRMS